MTFKYNNVYIADTSTVVGPYEKEGPLGNYFDKCYSDLYCGAKSVEQAEIKMQKDSIDILLRKTKCSKRDLDLLISSDLLNQNIASNYSAKCYNSPFLGIYSACAGSAEGMIIGSNFIDSKQIKKAIITVSSHNLASEKQFRNPIEYGAPKEETSTFTATGAATVLLQNKKTNIKIESATIGRVVDSRCKDPNNMGAVMAGAAIDTIRTHLKDTKRDASYYDLILTGDLGKYGKEIVKEYLWEKDRINVRNNLDDCGTILYDLDHQKEVHAGGSGPVCSALVNYSYVLDKLRKKELKKVLLVPTGALFSPTSLFQKLNILSIAHAVSLEAL